MLVSWEEVGRETACAKAHFRQERLLNATHKTGETLHQPYEK
jgi:hypothetical protein